MGIRFRRFGNCFSHIVSPDSTDAQRITTIQFIDVLATVTAEDLETQPYRSLDVVVDASPGDFVVGSGIHETLYPYWRRDIRQ